MKKRLFSIVLVMAFMLLSISSAIISVKAADTNSIEVNLRIEGLNETIAEGKSKGATLQEILESFLKSKNLSYDFTGGFINSINGIKNTDNGKNYYWMYYKKAATGCEFIWDGLSTYVPKENETIVVYYSDTTVTSVVSNISFTPNLSDDKKDFTMKFIYNDYTGKANPIVNAMVNIDNKYNYTTDSNGEIKVSEKLEVGDHFYKISGYRTNQSPIVAMDKGIFTIDENFMPTMSYAPQKEQEMDNSKIIKNIDEEVKALSDYIAKNNDDPWAALTLAKLGLKGGDSFVNEMAQVIKESGVESLSNTELEKLILNLTALGYTPYDFANSDLVKELLNRNEKDFLINDAVFALLTYNYAKIDGSYNLTREKLVNFILKQKLSYEYNGNSVSGWALTGEKINPDITGSVLNALAPLDNEEHPDIQKLIDDVVKSLSLLQNESGYFSDNFGTFSESQAFVISGLVAVGEEPEGVMFTKLKGDLLSALLSFKGTEGQFKHELGSGNNYMSTEQALRALYSYQQYKKLGKYNFYEDSIDASKLPVYKLVINDNKGESTKESMLPKTGSLFDLNTAFIISSLFITAGILLLKRSSRRG